ncbi:PiggyBac transposable element-derived protein 4 [Eumeta japonica]|uniref:PiggyBac transposable element-derived protein 4 n=1 Tax=Eumeta variegata TaxID=151549 RepID=A0A4C1VM40_EUMVA|nr:PiggyBac transposable element-derived protein 4 [Eumeta japonica]
MENEGLGYNVVSKLCQNVPRNSLVAFDNFFTGCNLLESLYEKGIYSVGTVRINRKGLPDIFKKKQPKNLRLLKHEFAAVTASPITAIKWLDTREVTVLTTAHQPRDTTFVKRTQKNGSRQEIHKIILQNGTEENNLAILETEIDIEFNEFVKSACISLHDNVTQINPGNTIAVGYNATNDLNVITLVQNSRSQCLNERTGANDGTTKRVYCVHVQEGNTVCPNLGSVYVSQSTEPPEMSLLAILADVPDDCHKTLSFTSLLENLRWIEGNVNS